MAATSQWLHGICEIESVVRGYCILKISWTLVIIEELILEIKDSTDRDKHPIAMMDDGYVVSHVAHSISKVSCFILQTQ